jgi:hypothetical protein
MGRNNLCRCRQAPEQWNRTKRPEGQRCEAFFFGKPQRRSMPVGTSSSGASATEWRQVVATDASPWIVRKQRFSVPKGRQAVLEHSSCRPFGTHRQCSCPSTVRSPLVIALPSAHEGGQRPGNIFSGRPVSRTERASAIRRRTDCARLRCSRALLRV